VKIQKHTPPHRVHFLSRQISSGLSHLSSAQHSAKTLPHVEAGAGIQTVFSAFRTKGAVHRRAPSSPEQGDWYSPPQGLHWALMHCRVAVLHAFPVVQHCCHVSPQAGILQVPATGILLSLHGVAPAETCTWLHVPVHGDPRHYVSPQ
jgi:hypothetical protein